VAQVQQLGDSGKSHDLSCTCSGYAPSMARQGMADPICIDSDDEGAAEWLFCRLLVPHDEDAQRNGAQGMRFVGLVSVTLQCKDEGFWATAEPKTSPAVHETQLVIARKRALSNDVSQSSVARVCVPSTDVVSVEIRSGNRFLVELTIEPPHEATALLAPHAGSWPREGMDTEAFYYLYKCAFMPDEGLEHTMLATLRKWLPHVVFQGALCPSITPSNGVVAPLRLDNIELTDRDVELLADENCLNDSVLDFFLRLVVDVAAPDWLQGHLHVLNTFFFTKLTSGGVSTGEEGWDNVARWTRSLPGGLLEKSFVVFPINELNVHWWVAIVCHPGRAFMSDGAGGNSQMTKADIPRIVCMDSAEEPPPKARPASFLRGYLWREWIERNPHVACNSRGEEGKDALKAVVADVPKQTNGYDCGIFIIEYLLHVLQSRSALKSLGLAPHKHWFGQVAVSHRRKRMHWIAKRLQSEAQKRSEPDVSKLLKEKTIRAAVLWALRDHPKEKDCSETAMDNGGPEGEIAPAASSARGSVGVQTRATMAAHASACTELTDPWAKRPRDSLNAMPKRVVAPRLIQREEREIINPMFKGQHFPDATPEHAEEGELGELSTPGSAFALLSS